MHERWSWRNGSAGRSEHKTSDELRQGESAYLHVGRDGMKQLHAARHAVEAHLIAGFLTSHGISAEVRGEFLTSGWGELPVDVCSVWVMDDAQFEAASELLTAFLKGNFARRFSGQSWSCPRCGEKLEGQFTQCWRCGTARSLSA